MPFNSSHLGLSTVLVVVALVILAAVSVLNIGVVSKTVAVGVSEQEARLLGVEEWQSELYSASAAGEIEQSQREWTQI